MSCKHSVSPLIYTNESIKVGPKWTPLAMYAQFIDLCSKSMCTLKDRRRSSLLREVSMDDGFEIQMCVPAVIRHSVFSPTLIISKWTHSNMPSLLSSGP